MTHSGNATLHTGNSGLHPALCACTGGLVSELRLKCLELAFDHVESFQEEDRLRLAGEYFAFVTDARPDGPIQLYVIENREEPQDSDAARMRFLSINGGWVFWSVEFGAYRFRSYAEAEHAIGQFKDDLGGDMTIVPLPLGTELF